MSSTPTSESSQTEQHPKNFTAFTISELPPMTFPPLPPVTNQALYYIVTSHSSKNLYPKSSMDLNPTRMIEDYEKLEHVGDALLGAMIAILLHDLFPFLGEGPATTLKSSLVSNATLARISDAYKIPDKLQASPSALRLTRVQVKTRASMFEAWIAGVFYSALEIPASIANVDEEGYEGGDEALADEIADAVEVGVIEEDQSGMRTAVERVESERISVGKSQHGEKASDIDTISASSGALSVDESCESEAFSNRASVTSPAQSIDQVSSKPLTADSSSSVATTPTSIEEPDDDPASDQQIQDDSSKTVTVTAAFQELSVLTNNKLKFRWLAMIALDEWLRPLFTPIAYYALAELRKEQARLALLPRAKMMEKQVLDAAVVAENLTAVGALSVLHIHAQQSKLPVSYQHEKVDVGWRVVCTVGKADGSVVTGEGIRGNQKTAKSLAAHKACLQLNI